MNYIIFPEDESTFLNNVKESFTTDLENGCKMFYHMYLKLMSIEEENETLKKTNEKLLQDFDHFELTHKKTKKEHENLVSKMIQREEDLINELKILSLQPNQRTSKMTEIKEIKRELDCFKEENETLRRNYDDLQSNERTSDLNYENSIKNNDETRLLKAKIKKEAKLKTQYYRENKALKNDYKFNKVKKHDCQYHKTNVSTEKSDRNFLEFKNNFFNVYSPRKKLCKKVSFAEVLKRRAFSQKSRRIFFASFFSKKGKKITHFFEIKFLLKDLL